MGIVTGNTFLSDSMMQANEAAYRKDPSRGGFGRFVASATDLSVATTIFGPTETQGRFFKITSMTYSLSAAQTLYISAVYASGTAPGDTELPDGGCFFKKLAASTDFIHFGEDGPIIKPNQWVRAISGGACGALIVLTGKWV